MPASKRPDNPAPRPGRLRRLQPGIAPGVSSAIALGALVAVSAGLAILLHRNGHSQGDDFALYLRQSRSIFDGDIGEVLADNRFTVANSSSGFSPFAYPWGWPLLLSPFVKLWGYDYDRLKLLEVASFCVWMVLVNGVVRRRVGRGIALAVTAVVATAPALLAHTDQLLSEYPHAATVALFVWWLDRMRSHGRLLDAAQRDLWVLGALITLTFNFRRETIVFVGVVGLVQLIEFVVDVHRRRLSVRETYDAVPWRQALTPHVATTTTVVAFQLLMPSMLFPDNGNSSAFVGERLGDYSGWLSKHLGLGWHPTVGTLVLVLMVIGMVIAVQRRPGLDGPLVLIALTTLFAASTHFRMVDRYYFQMLPWVVYFATVATGAGVGAIARLVRPSSGSRARAGSGVGRRGPVRFVTFVTVLPLLFVVAVHAAVLPGDVRDARRFDAAGRQQIGPTHPDVVPIYAAVAKYTRPTDVVAFFRARTMTLLTDRLSVQTGRIERIISNSDFFAQRRNSGYVQPEFTEAEGVALGLEVVWSDRNWVLWQIPVETRQSANERAAAEARGAMVGG